jgi:hypothetical protein
MNDFLSQLLTFVSSSNSNTSSPTEEEDDRTHFVDAKRAVQDFLKNYTTLTADEYDKIKCLISNTGNRWSAQTTVLRHLFGEKCGSFLADLNDSDFLALFSIANLHKFMCRHEDYEAHSQHEINTLCLLYLLVDKVLDEDETISPKFVTNNDRRLFSKWVGCLLDALICCNGNQDETKTSAELHLVLLDDNNEEEKKMDNAKRIIVDVILHCGGLFCRPPFWKALKELHVAQIVGNNSSNFVRYAHQRAATKNKAVKMGKLIAAICTPTRVHDDILAEIDAETTLFAVDYANVCMLAQVVDDIFDAEDDSKSSRTTTLITQAMLLRDEELWENIREVLRRGLDSAYRMILRLLSKKHPLVLSKEECIQSNKDVSIFFTTNVNSEELLLSSLDSSYSYLLPSSDEEVDRILTVLSDILICVGKRTPAEPIIKANWGNVLSPLIKKIAHFYFS